MPIRPSVARGDLKVMSLRHGTIIVFPLQPCDLHQSGEPCFVRMVRSWAGNRQIRRSSHCSPHILRAVFNSTTNPGQKLSVDNFQTVGLQQRFFTSSDLKGPWILNLDTTLLGDTSLTSNPLVNPI